MGAGCATMEMLDRDSGDLLDRTNGQDSRRQGGTTVDFPLHASLPTAQFVDL